MPIPQTVRVNPLDLQGNIAIGISLPFNGPAGPFNSTYSTKDQTKSNLINLLLTNKGERVMNPEFGCDLKRILFDQITEDTFNSIQQTINESITSFIPEIETTDVIIENNPDYDNNNLISITVKYRLRISQNPDQVTVQFI
jgi:phage baseplate assembly protein W